MENWAYNATEGRAIRIATGVEPRAMTIENNAMIKENAPEQFVKITGNTENVSIDKNYWNGANPVGNYRFRIFGCRRTDKKAMFFWITLP